MRVRLTSLTACLALLTCGGAAAQAYVGPMGNPVGTPVDRNVADTSANAASNRLAQPGLGQFGVGSLLLDRYADRPYDPTRFDPFAGDPRTSQRYVLQAPGFTALTQQPDYIGPSPQGGWVRNAQTYDGAEVMTLGSANTVFVLSPELLSQQTAQLQRFDDHPNRLRLDAFQNHGAYMLDLRVVSPLPGHASQQGLYGNKNKMGPAPTSIDAAASNPNYVHPEIIQRRQRWKAEREAEAAKQAAEARQEQNKAASE